MASLRIPALASSFVVIEKVPEEGEPAAAPSLRDLPRAGRRLFPPPWAEGRVPPWSAVLPAPEPVRELSPVAADATSVCLVPADADVTDPGFVLTAAVAAAPSRSVAAAPVVTAAPSVAAAAAAVASSAAVAGAAVASSAPVVAVAPGARPAPPPGMVWVPAREIRTGEQAFLVDGYFLDRSLVTRAAWAEWLAAGGGVAPEGWRKGRPPAGTEDHPMTDVSWADAVAYATWRGARLPTVAEWLAAAAGLTWFPPGSERCGDQLCQCPRSGAATRGTAPVGTHPNSDSVDGASDLLGNAWEWAESDSRLPPPDPDHAWALGGSFKHACPALPNTMGTRVPMTMIYRGKSWPHLGLRCARSAT